MMSISRPGQLPNDIREQMLSSGHGHGALMVDLLCFYGIQHEWVTVDQVMSVSLCNETLVRKALSDSIIFLARPVKTGKRGRPKIEYIMRSTGELEFTFGARYLRAYGGKLHDPFIDALPEVAFSSMARYKLELHREFLTRNSEGEWFQCSMSFMASRMGVSTRTLRRYHEHIDVEIKPVINYKPLPKSAVSRLPDEAIGGTWIEIGDVRDVAARTAKRLPFIRGALEKHVDNDLWIVNQEPNMYRVVRTYPELTEHQKQVYADL